MALIGNLRDFALHDFLYLVAQGSKTGSMLLYTVDDAATLYIERGKLISVVQPRRAERFGELLVRLGKITPAQLRQGLDLQRASRGSLLGTILVEQGYVDESDLQTFIRMFIEHIVYDLFTWNEGTFEWRARERPAPDEIQTPVPLIVENLIMEGVRRVDELARIRGRIPSNDMVVRTTALASEPGGEVNLTAGEWRIFARIDNQRSINALAQTLSLPSFEVSSIVYALIGYGLVEIAGAGVGD